jgi:histone deacetylase 6
MGDIDYLAAMHHVILPIARLYQPQLVLVSAGFDAAEGDAIGEYHVSKEGNNHNY